MASWYCQLHGLHGSIGGLVVEYIVAIDVTRVRFLADAPGGPADSRPGHVKEVGPLHRRRGCRACTHVYTSAMHKGRYKPARVAASMADK